MIKPFLFFLLFISTITIKAQIPVDLSHYAQKAKTALKHSLLTITWPAGKTEQGKIILNLENKKPLFKSIQLSSNGIYKEIASELDPAFILTIGKRDLVSQNGWNIFFDTTNRAPHKSFNAILNKQSVSVSSEGTRTVIKVLEITAGSFTGAVEITLYDGSPLLNVAAVMSTKIDSTAILYDAGLVSKSKLWNKIAWSDTENHLQSSAAVATDKSKNQAVKYRTIIGQSNEGSLALFPAPHQYFYPLDEAFNLKFTWHGSNYRTMIPDYGIGIRQDLMGDNRWVPWFNAPPDTKQRLNFFCLLSTNNPEAALEEVKKFTHGDSYLPLPGYKTMSSHFHNEYVMKVLLANKPAPAVPGFINVFKNTGINIVHLAEFHYTAHPKGPDDQRLLELKTLFDMCKKYSSKNFLLLPGEEPNEFFGGHWLDFFPKPVYWIMSGKPGIPFVSETQQYGKVYHINDKDDMLKLLETENGLAWTAHARTKGSTGFPDKYKNEPFFTSDHFLGAAWKAMPSDLSQPFLGKRVLDLMDDMANWGLKKHVLAEADLFSIEPENEMYAHLNVNYLQLNSLPEYKDGWQPVLDVIKQGKFFVTTGEVLIPSFTINGKKSGETLSVTQNGKAEIALEVSWTFPLNFAEIISGDGNKVYHEKINLTNTKAFGSKKFIFNTNVKNRKWIRVEIWDVAANGAFMQQVWLKQ